MRQNIAWMVFYKAVVPTGLIYTLISPVGTTAL